MNNTLDVFGYEILDCIGEGTFGTVYRAKQKSTGQITAIKVLKENAWTGISYERRKARFLREIQVCAALRHPYIVQILDQGSTKDDQLYAVFEFVEGETLQELLKRKGALPVRQLKVIMCQVLEALVYAHQKGVIHRDLKPGNIMVHSIQERTYVKILDFGMGGFLEESGVHLQTLTLPSDALGTPSYGAPEQLRGERPSSKSDLYSWGLVFLECLTGEPVMKGASVADIIHQQLMLDDIILPAGIASHPIASLLRRVLAKRVEDRVSDASAILRELEEIHLDDLVGSFQASAKESSSYYVADETAEGVLAGRDLQEITLLCYAIQLTSSQEKKAASENRDFLFRSIKNIIADTVSKYGGYAAGSLGDFHLCYFGYPQSTDMDASLAARCALNIKKEIELFQQKKLVDGPFHFNVRMAIHSGPILVERGSVPSGEIPHEVIRLTALTPAGEIYLSHSSCDRLIQRMNVARVENLDSLFENQVSVLISEKSNSPQLFQPSLPFIGRNKERECLKNSFEEVKKGSLVSFLIQGEPGIGKTSLIRSLYPMFQSEETIIEEGQCLPEYKNNALYPIWQVIRRELNISEKENPLEAVKKLKDAFIKTKSDMETFFPLCCLWLSLPIPESYELKKMSFEEQKNLLFEGLRHFIHYLASHQLVLVVEDLHWADPTTLEWIHFLLEKNDTTAMLILLTARPEFKSPFSKNKVSTISLSELSTKEAQELVLSLTQDNPIASAIQSNILNRAGGLPIFLETLTQTIVKKVSSQSKSEELLRASFWGTIPNSLMDLLNAQIHQLHKSRETAQIASIIGRDFDYELMAQVSFLSEEDLKEDLSELLAQRIIEYKETQENAVYSFKHALLKEAAYLSVTQAKKKEYHSRIAKILEKNNTNPNEQHFMELSKHYAGAGDFEKAISIGISAASSFLNKASLLEAINLSFEILDWIALFQNEIKEEYRLQVHRILTQALMSSHGWADPKVKKYLDISRNLLDEIGESRHYGPILCSLMTYHYVSSNRKELKCVSQEVMHHAEVVSDIGLEIAGKMFYGLWAHGAGFYEEAERYFEYALNHYNPVEHKNHGELLGIDTRAWSYATLALIKWFRNDSSNAILFSEKGVEWAKELNHIPSLCITLLYKANLCHYRGNRELAEETVMELNKLAETYNLPAYKAYAQIMLAWIEKNPGKAEKEIKMLEDMGCTAALSYYRSLLADIYADQGRYDLAVENIKTCLLLCESNDEYYYQFELLRLEALYLSKGANPKIEESAIALEKAKTVALSQGIIFSI